jgi:protein tyrosine phosphatase (PTP) superfamily phosphohydrolase (DUF442 family)
MRLLSCPNPARLFPASALARPRTWLRLGLAVALVAFLWEAVRVMALSNRHAVIPARVYRCAQPSADDLREMTQKYGIRTVVNLRGLSPDFDWYAAEARTTHELNVSQEDITFSANRLPAPAELRRLIDVLDHTEYPVLIHCKRGADRTGMTAAVVQLLYTDATLSQALRQLWPRYGHFEFGRTAAMDAFFDRYEAWLTEKGIEHTPARFREWATTVYTPGPAMSELVWLEVPNAVPKDKPCVVKLRAVNRSSEPWEFRPGNYAGIHLYYVVAASPTAAVYKGQAGLQRQTVPPGGYIDLTLPVPPLLVPGKYVLAAELHDARGAGVPIRANSFVQFGDAGAMTEIVVK